MDGAGETSLPAAAMKTVRSSLRRVSRSPSPETLASRCGSADAAETCKRWREYETQCSVYLEVIRWIFFSGGLKSRRDACIRGLQRLSAHTGAGCTHGLDEANMGAV